MEMIRETGVLISRSNQFLSDLMVEFVDLKRTLQVFLRVDRRPAIVSGRAQFEGVLCVTS